MWFDPHSVALIGAISGSVLGLLAGIWGTLAGIYVRKGKLKKLILSYAVVLVVVGLIYLCIGIIAMVSKQPYSTWYPMTLIGVILTGALLSGFFLVKRIYVKTALTQTAQKDY